MMDTFITRQLDAAGVPYEVSVHPGPVYTVDEAARARGVDPSILVKTILLREKGGRYVVACVQGHRRLDVKAVRHHLPAGWLRLQFASPEEVRDVTGSVQGAVAPLGLPPDIPLLFDSGIAELETVSISSGTPQAGLLLASRDLIRISRARLAPICRI